MNLLYVLYVQSTRQKSAPAKTNYNPLPSHMATKMQPSAVRNHCRMLAICGRHCDVCPCICMLLGVNAGGNSPFGPSGCPGPPFSQHRPRDCVQHCACVQKLAVAGATGILLQHGHHNQTNSNIDDPWHLCHLAPAACRTCAMLTAGSARSHGFSSV